MAKAVSPKVLQMPTLPRAPKVTRAKTITQTGPIRPFNSGKAKPGRPKMKGSPQVRAAKKGPANG